MAETVAPLIRRAVPQCSTLVVTTTGHDTETTMGVRTQRELHLTQVNSSSFVMENANLEEAITCAADPTNGIARHVAGVPAALCVVVAAQAANVGANEQLPELRAARAASVIGVPTIAIFNAAGDEVPTAEASHAMADLIRASANVLVEERSTWTKPANCPRAHYPFPEKGRWGSTLAQVNASAELKRAVASSATSATSFELSDCWSIGGEVILSEDERGDMSASDARAVLRRAFCDGDIFLSATIPPRFAPNAKRFAATRPGVLWRQDTVDTTSAFDATATYGDQYGRSLPLHKVGDAHPTLAGARFVPQRHSAEVVEETKRALGSSNVPDTTAIPKTFRITAGTKLSDNSMGGDVDALLACRCGVTLSQTWPCGHACSLLDRVVAEALNEDNEGDGMPLWLAEVRCDRL